MKSCFLLSLLLALFSQVSFAQMTMRPTHFDLEKPKTSFQKFSDRLKISYWGMPTTPTFYDMEKGNWKYAATSEGFKTFDTHRDSIPANFFNQLSFNFNFGAKLNFVVNPRFSTFFARPADTKQNADNGFFVFEDVLVGFQGTVISSDDKKFNLWIRPGTRLSTSRGTRESKNGGFGTTSGQYELSYLPTYDFTKEWQLGIYGQIRQWTFEDRYNYSRLRFYTAPFIQYTINDTTRVAWYYESMVENNKRWKSINGKEPQFKDVYQDTFIGINHDVTSKFNIFPFLAMFTDRRIDSKSFWIGAWISYQIK